MRVVYEAVLEDDLGHRTSLGVFEEQEDAKKAAAERCGRSYPAPPRALMIWDSFDEFRNYDEKEIRAKALNKLTDTEKRVLGLK